MENDEKRLHVRLRGPLLEWIKAYCYDNRLTVSEVLRTAAEEFKAKLDKPKCPVCKIELWSGKCPNCGLQR